VSNRVKSFSDLKAQDRKDSWINMMTGLGMMARDKRLHTNYIPNDKLDEETLNALYCSDGLGRRIIDVLTGDLTRKWFEVTGDTDGTMNKEMKRFRLRIIEAVKWGLLHGGSVGVIGIEDGGYYDEPVDENNIQKVTHLHVFDRWRTVWTTADLYSDPANPKYATPEFYTIFPINPATTAAGPAFGRPNTVTTTTQFGRKPIRSGGPSDAGYNSLTQLVLGGNVPAVGAFRVHESRVIRFDGTLVPLKERIRNRYWNHSYLQFCFERLRGLGGAFADVEHIISEFIVGELTMNNLINMISGNDDQKVLRRLQQLDMTRAVHNTVLTDTGEKYEKKSSTVTGLNDLVGTLLTGLCICSGIPEIKLLGKTVTGLGSTGNTNLRSYYDDVAAMQLSIIEEPCTKLCRYIMLAKQGPFKGVEIDNWELDFPDLLEMSEQEEADLRLKVAQSDVAYINAGVLAPREEVAESRFGGDSYSTETILDKGIDKELSTEALIQQAGQEGGGGQTEPEPGTTDVTVRPKQDSSDGIDVSDCNLKTLKKLKLPKVLNGFLIVSGNKLTDHVGAPERVNGCFQSNHNPLKSLKGTPKYVQDFHCNSCQLKSLMGAPIEVDDFHVHDNELSSFKGVPQVIKKDLHCYMNKLSSFEFLPSEIGGDLFASDNQFTNLKFFPKKVGGDVDLQHNPGNFSEKEIREVCEVKGEVRI
jgi:hypothetical protein